jgi:hypothetical protein
VRHIVGLSGGKDSSALALRLREVEPRPYEYAITPTGDELPEMVEHWRTLSALLETPLTVVTSGHSLSGLIRHYNSLPTRQMRWCTRQLKIEPYEQFLFTAAPCVSYVGLRADEEERRGGIYDHIEGVEQRYPLREWGWKAQDVFNYLGERGVVIPRRTDCARCFYQRLEEWWNLYKDHPEIYAEAEAEEEATGHTFRAPEHDSFPVSLKALRASFEGGRRPRDAGQLAFFGRDGMCRACTL